MNMKKITCGEELRNGLVCVQLFMCAVQPPQKVGWWDRIILKAKLLVLGVGGVGGARLVGVLNSSRVR